MGIGRRSELPLKSRLDSSPVHVAKRALVLVPSGSMTSVSFFSDSASALRLITPADVCPSPLQLLRLSPFVGSRRFLPISQHSKFLWNGPSVMLRLSGTRERT